MPGIRAAGIAVVTDSTAYLPAGVADDLAVTTVPLQVIVSGVVRAEGSEMTAGQVAAALVAGEPVSTSRPSPTLFAQVYADLLGAGAAGVVSVHLSGAMSGTWEAAQLGAAECGGPVAVVDSGSVAMGLGFGVMAAARAARDGADLSAVADAARLSLDRTKALFYVDTLEFLRRGGRIGTARAFLGSALSIRPLLRITDGRIAPLEKVRTTSRALARLEDLAVELAGAEPVAVAVHHLGAPVRAAELAENLDARIPKLDELYTSEVGAVVGAHTGPGMVGVVVHRL